MFPKLINMSEIQLYRKLYILRVAIFFRGVVRFLNKIFGVAISSSLITPALNDISVESLKNLLWFKIIAQRKGW